MLESETWIERNVRMGGYERVGGVDGGGVGVASKGRGCSFGGGEVSERRMDRSVDGLMQEF